VIDLTRGATTSGGAADLSQRARRAGHLGPPHRSARGSSRTAHAGCGRTAESPVRSARASVGSGAHRRQPPTPAKLEQGSALRHPADTGHDLPRSDPPAGAPGVQLAGDALSIDSTGAPCANSGIPTAPASPPGRPVRACRSARRGQRMAAPVSTAARLPRIRRPEDREEPCRGEADQVGPPNDRRTRLLGQHPQLGQHPDPSRRSPAPRRAQAVDLTARQTRSGSWSVRRSRARCRGDRAALVLEPGRLVCRLRSAARPP